MLGFCKILFALILTSSLAFADNKEVSVTSSATNTTIYDVVVGYEPLNLKGEDTKKKPGIYAISPSSGRSIAVLQGNIPGVNRSYKGVVVQVDGANGRGGTLDSITVLDGRITLFNKNSRPKKPNSKKAESIVQFGVNAKATDALSGSSVEIPLIDNPSSLNVSSKVIFDSYTNPTTGRYHDTATYTFSIKSASPLGTGLTFIATVIIPDKTSDTPKVVPGSLRVVNYNYLNSKELQHIVETKNSDKIISSTVVDKFLMDLEAVNQDSPLIEKWIKRIKASMGQIGKRALSDEETALLPKVHPLTGEVSLDHIPGMIISNGDSKNEYSLIQFYDPIDKKWVISRQNEVSPTHVFKVDKAIPLYNRRKVNQNTVAEGKVSYNSSRKRYVEFEVPSEDPMQQISFLSSDQNTLLLLPMEYGRDTTTVKINSSELSESKRFSATRHVYTIDKKEFHLVIVSYTLRSGRKRTVGYTFVKKPDGELKLDQEQIILENYLTQAELEKRITQTNINSKTTVPVFDVLTKVKGASAYGRKPIAERTVAMLNLHKAVDHKIGEKFVHVKMERSEEIIPGVLNYRSYNTQGTDLVKTGFYINYKSDEEVSTNSPLRFIPGELMFERRKSKTVTPLNKFTIGQKTIEYSPKGPFSGEPKVRISLVPVNPRPGKKPSLTKTKLAVVTAPVASDSTFQPTATTIDVGFGLDNVSAVEIIQGKRVHENEVTVLFFLKPTESVPTAQGVISYSFLVKTEKSKSRVRTNYIEKSGSWLTKSPTTPGELAHLLKESASGHFYWVHTPEVETDKAKYAVRQLTSPASLLYPSGSDRSINLKFDREFTLKDMSSSFSISDWKVPSTHSLKNRTGWGFLDDLVTKIQKAIKAKGKEKVNIPTESFPLLAEYLNRFVDKDLIEDNKKRRIILVEDRLKKDVLEMIGYAAVEGEKGEFTVASHKTPFDFYLFDIASSADEIVEELGQIAASDPTRPSLLFADIKDINAIDNPLVEVNSDEEDEYTDEDRLEEFDTKKTSRWLLLGTDGKATKLKGFKRTQSYAPQVPMFILATPNELREARSMYSDEETVGVFDNFEIINDFQTSSWTLWAPDSSLATKDLKDLARTPISEEEYQVFPEIEELLTQVSKGEAKGKRKIIIVPDELKPLIDKLILARWASKYTNDPDGWHYKNTDLEVFRLAAGNERVTQESVADNFSAIRGKAKNRNVALIGQLSDIANARRPGANGRSFKLKDPAVARASVDLFDDDEFQAVIKNTELERTEEDIKLENLRSEQRDLNIEIRDTRSEMEDYREGDSYYQELADKIQGFEDQKAGISREIASLMNSLMSDGSDSSEPSTAENLPHLMWEIATEGLRFQPKRRRGWTVAEELTDSYSTLLIGTESELEDIKLAMGEFEDRFFDVEKHFDISRIQSPTVDTKFNLINSLFSKAEIRSLGYKFSIEGKSDEESTRELISHLIHRTDQIAGQLSIEPTTAFIKVFTEFRRALTEDSSLRRNGLIDQNYLERMFAKVFPQPLKLDTLEKDDPLKILSDTQKASKMLEDAGYQGSSQLKRRLFGNILSSTRGAQGGRQIPSSTIVFGDTGTGKTFLIKKLFEMLELNKYDPMKPNNEEADYYILKVESLVEGDENGNSNDPSKITVKQAIANIKDLLAQPKGHRAHILIDDAHKTASSKIQEELFAFIQSLFEAEDGVLHVKRKDSSEVREVPVQNVNIYMTLNPTADQDALRKYNAHYGAPIENKVLAALSRTGYKIEESFLARFSDIINMAQFPRSAKVPALVTNIREMTSNTPYQVLVSPNAIDTVVRKFPKAHAREFLSPAAIALTRLPPTVEKAPIYIVQPRSTRKSMPGSEADEGLRQGGSLAGFGEGRAQSRDRLDAGDLERSISQLTQVQPVTFESSYGIVDMMSFIMHGFRTQVFNNVVVTAQSTDLLSIDVAGMRGRLKSAFSTGLSYHIIANSKIPVSEISMNGNNLSYLSELVLSEVYEIQREARPLKDYFPIDMTSNSLKQRASFLSGDADFSNQGRREVIAETIREVKLVLMQGLQAYMRVDSNDEIQKVLDWTPEEIAEWFHAVPEENNMEESFKRISTELLGLFQTFQSEMHSKSLTEMHPDDPSVKNINGYQSARLFSYILDKAITELPWGLAAKFAIDVSDRSNDLQLGQRPSYLKYAHEHDLSIFTISTPDFLEEVLGNVSTESKTKALEERFVGMCKSVLSGGA